MISRTRASVVARQHGRFGKLNRGEEMPLYMESAATIQTRKTGPGSRAYWMHGSRRGVPNEASAQHVSIPLIAAGRLP